MAFFISVYLVFTGPFPSRLDLDSSCGVLQVDIGASMTCFYADAVYVLHHAVTRILWKLILSL